MTTPIGVTGATGHIGGAVATALAQAGVPLRLLVRDPRRAPDLPGATVHRLDYGRDATGALDGVSTLLLVSGAESVDRVAEHRAVIDDAAEAGVDHVVYTSFVGAGPDATFTLARDHGATEEHLRASGMAWTFLRDNLYLDLVPLFAGPDDVLRGPAGEGRFAGVARADVAAVATAVLLDPRRHAGRTYQLTGPEPLSLHDVAAAVRAATGRDVRYHAESPAEAYASRAVFGAPDWQVEAWVSTYTAIAAGELEQVTDDVERLVGRPPLSLAGVLAQAGAPGPAGPGQGPAAD